MKWSKLTNSLLNSQSNWIDNELIIVKLNNRWINVEYQVASCEEDNLPVLQSPELLSAASSASAGSGSSGDSGVILPAVSGDAVPSPPINADIQLHDSSNGD